MFKEFGELIMYTNWYKGLVQMSNMSSPQRHPSSGIYYFRQAVPKPLIPIIGKTVLKASLRTSNLSEAKRLIIPFLVNAEHQIALAKIKIEGNSSHKFSKRDCGIIANR